MKTIIERGASWTLEETKMLLALWGQDLVQRQATNTKRTKEVYEKISEKFNQNGFERTADQVRTRVFNMIAEYRRILKDPSTERMKKCIFFEALHKIYQAKHMDDVKSALDDYEPEYPYSPVSNTISSEKGDESVSDSEATDGNETINNNLTTNSSSGNNLFTSANNSSSMASGESMASDKGTKINQTTDEKDSSIPAVSSQSASAQTGGSSSNSGGTSKKIKLESPKSGSHQTNQANMASASALSSLCGNSSNPSSSTENPSSKLAKAPLIASIGGSGSTASITSASAATASTSSSSLASTSTSSSQKHQSLLLPNATTPATTTPIGKLTTSGGNNTPSYININSTKLPIIRTNQLIGHSNGNESINLNGTATRLPTTAAIASHQLYQAPVNTFDVTSSALLIDRMFAHLSRESENMREWIALEKERLALERARRQQETEREVRRERVLIDTLMRFQEQWLAFLSRLDPRIIENAEESPPELKVPPKDVVSGDGVSQSSVSQQTNITTATSNNSNLTSDAGK